MPNLRAGFVITASLPASMVLSTLELLAEGVAPIPLDGSTVVEVTVCPTSISSLDDTIRGILAAGLKKAKHKSANQKQKVLDSKITSYLLVASSLGGATMLPRHGSSTLGMPSLSIGSRRRAEIPIAPLPSFFLICTNKIIRKYCLYDISYEHT